MPFALTAALILTIQSLLMFLFLTRLSLYSYFNAFITAQLATLNILLLAPINPFANFNIFLCLFTLTFPRFTLIFHLPILNTSCMVILLILNLLVIYKF